MVLHELVAYVALNVNKGLSREIAGLHQQGIEVDNNEPFPENAHPSAPLTHTIGQWVTQNIYPNRADVSCRNTKGVWRLHSWTNNSEMTEISLFRMAFPEQWVRGVLIQEINKEIEGNDITLQEFYVYFGCHFFMVCFEGIYDWRLWLSPKQFSIREESPFRLQKYMSLLRFIYITYAMRFIEKPFPSFLDRFHYLRQMINNFNEHYLENYTPSWLSCLNELMNYFLENLCQGFMSVPRKPHPIGIE